MSAGTITVGRHPLTAVGPQAEAGRYSSTRPLASGRLGSMYTVTDRISASIDVSLTTAIRAPTVQVLENSKTWISVIISSLILWIDLWWGFLNLGGC